jgi:hypothetical protein
MIELQLLRMGEASAGLPFFPISVANCSTKPLFAMTLALMLQNS